MCGIAGVVTWDGQGATRDVDRMIGALAHRGPDDRDIVSLGKAVLGHARLSILDVTPAGHQPMSTDDGVLWLTFNGEIYNFASLRAELEGDGYRFVSATDTEVLLAGYRAWGTRVFARLNGIWALALWDTINEVLLLSRDRFGVKPLFVTESRSTIAFASEIKALRTLPWFSPEPDEQAVNDYLHGAVVDRPERTFLRAVRRVWPATFETHSSQASTTDRYWAPSRLSDDASFGRRPGDSELVDCYRTAFFAAVERQLQSDVVVGSCLSGGLDSSSIVSTAAGLRRRRSDEGGSLGLGRVEYPQLGFFARFTGDRRLDEYQYAKAVAAATGLDLKVVVPTAQTFLGALAQTVRAQDEPFASTSIVAQMLVMSLARSAGVKVLLDGQGADELFGGQQAYIGPRLAGLGVPSAVLSPRLILAVASAFAEGRIPTGRVWSRVRRKVRGSLGLAPRPSPLMRFAGPRASVLPAPRTDYAEIDGSPLSRALWKSLTYDTLPALLRYEDRNSMAFSIEARVPFLDHELVDLVLALPDRLKLDPRITKVALRESMRGIVPDVVLDRTDKVGYEPPQAAWLRAAMPHLRSLAVKARSEELGFIRASGVDAVMEEFELSHLSHTAAWRVVNLELWLRIQAGESLLDIDAESGPAAR